MKKILLFAMFLVPMVMANAQNKAFQISVKGSGAMFSDFADTVDDMTVEAWVWIDGAAVADKRMGSFNVVVDFRGTTGTEGFLIRPNLDDPTKIGAHFETGNHYNHKPVAGNVIEVDTWTHVAWVFNSLDGFGYIYLNGKQVDSYAFTAIGPPIELGSSLTVGHSTLDDSRSWIGLLDEIRIWRTVRTEDEIFDNMLTSVGKNDVNLIAYYKCDDADLSGVLTDASPNKYDAKILGPDYAFPVSTVPDFVAAVGVNKYKNSKVSLYPNPIKDKIHVKGMDLTNAQINIYTLSGQLVCSPVSNGSTIDVANLKSGFYIVKIENGSERMNFKIIK